MWLVLQTFSGFYLGWFLVLSLIFAFFALFYFLPDRVIVIAKSLKENYKNVLLIVVFWGFLLSIFWMPYVVTSLKYKTTFDWEIYRKNLPEVTSFVKLPSNSLYNYLIGHRNQPFGYGDYMFPGMFGVISLVLGVKVLTKRTPTRGETILLAKVFFVVSLTLLVISLKVFGFSLWQGVNIFVPGADAIRYTYRIWVIAYFYLYISGGMLLTAYAKYIPKVLTFLLLGFFFVENLNLTNAVPAYDMRIFERNSANIESEILNNKCNMFYISDESLQKPDLNITGQLTAVNASLRTNTPTLNGYSGFNPYKNADALSLEEIQNLIKLKSPKRFCYLHATYSGKILSIESIETFSPD